MTWQKCPICHGVGKIKEGYFIREGNTNTFTLSWLTAPTTDLCKICAGTGLVDELTGLPPDRKEET